MTRGLAGRQARIGSSQGAERFSREFIAAINRIQYNQGNDINGLAGQASCAARHELGSCLDVPQGSKIHFWLRRDGLAAAQH
jgi:hypothetical protein